MHRVVMAPFRLSKSSFLVVCCSRGEPVLIGSAVLQVYFSVFFDDCSDLRDLYHTQGKGDPEHGCYPPEPEFRVSLARDFWGHPLFRSHRQSDYGALPGYPGVFVFQGHYLIHKGNFFPDLRPPFAFFSLSVCYGERFFPFWSPWRRGLSAAAYWIRPAPSKSVCKVLFISVLLP